MSMINCSKLEKLCEQKAAEMQPKDFFKYSHAQANCVKVLLEIMSHTSERHKNAYESVKDVTFSAWRRIILKTGLIKEFTDRGVEEVGGPGPGVFAFWETRPGIIWGVGLCISDTELYWMDSVNRVFEKCNITDKKPVFYGTLNG